MKWKGRIWAKRSLDKLGRTLFQKKAGPNRPSPLPIDVPKFSPLRCRPQRPKGTKIIQRPSQSSPVVVANLRPATATTKSPLYFAHGHGAMPLLARAPPPHHSRPLHAATDGLLPRSASAGGPGPRRRVPPPSRARVRVSNSDPPQQQVNLSVLRFTLGTNPLLLPLSPPPQPAYSCPL